MLSVCQLSGPGAPHLGVPWSCPLVAGPFLVAAVVVVWLCLVLLG